MGARTGAASSKACWERRAEHLADYAHIIVGGQKIVSLETPLHQSAYEVFNRTHLRTEEVNDGEWEHTRIFYRIQAEELALRLKVLGYSSKSSIKIIERVVTEEVNSYASNPYLKHLDYKTEIDSGAIAKEVCAELKRLNGVLNAGQKTTHTFNDWINNNFSEHVERAGADFALCVGFPTIAAILVESVEDYVEFDVTDAFEGEISDEEIPHILRPSDERFLILTEGTSDRQILEHAISLAAPSVLDLFYFADEALSLPQTGATRVTELLKAFVALKVKNDVIAIYDNDSEGAAEHAKALEFTKSTYQISVVKLPSREEFRHVVCEGPDGHHVTDINGRAASIEMYLDRPIAKRGQPEVKWSAFLKKAGTWQGEPLTKRQIVSHFFSSFGSESYDASGINSILDTIFDAAAQISETRAEMMFERELGICLR